ncbi:phage tail tape measure protein [Mycolicibacterium sp. lyk4-40-TYG-92]|uniref:phage tail tape measure protein n=1 Tax=Mycolicibacterium sp. lyk4-40-TYG-92 TaxID=3040295 RepID=UPI00254DA9BB|nr:phage tail tape measure protein [Mycolicibacterium sp. lyk4-40-TYG-92]
MDPIILRIEPELDERAATSTMTRAQRVYEQGARDISKVMRQQLTQGTEAAGKGFDELETKARKAYLGMQDASEKVAAAERKHQAAVEKGAANAESLGRKVERARLAEIEAIERATAAYKEYGQAADQAGQSAVGGLRGAMAGVRSVGGEMASGFTEGFAGSAALARLGAAGGPIGIAIAGVAALGVTGGKVLADNIAAGMEQLRMRDLFQTRLGVDSATMQTIGTAAGAAYAKGFGGSVEENLKTISAGIRSGLIGPKSSDAELSKFTERMDTTSKITGQDPGEIAAKSRNIVRSGLAADYKEVLDLLNSEAGKQLDISGDLLDTTEEYATAWHGVGLSAADAFGLMKQMSDAGIRNTDVASDSLKELSINVADGSKSTKQAFTVLGFDAEEMNRKFAAGGDAARQAFGAVLTAMQDLKDPQDKENVGLALFKTKWEDAKTAIQAANLKTAANDMGNVAGATDKATPEINKHADAWGNLGRAIENTVDSFGRWLAKTGPGSFLWSDLPQMAADALTPHQSPDFSRGPIPFAPPVPGTPSVLSPGMWDPRNPGGPAPTQPGNPLTPGLNNLFPGMLPQNAPPPPADVGHGAQDKHWADAAPDDGKTKSLPPAPVLPLAYTSTAGLPSGIANAQQSLDERKHDVAEKEARLHQLEQTNVATADDIQKAKNDLAKAQQDQFKAEQSLTDARINATKQANKQLSGLSSDLNDLGAQLDKDFGISKGLGGIIENAVKALGNALAAPLLQALGFVSKANPNEGSGLVGVMAANGMFGQQYTPGAIAASQSQTQAMPSGGPAAQGIPGLSPSFIPPGMPQPGESARDFAHRVMMPYWQNQGLTVGDHQADKYGEHQNGALDIMVPNLAAGQQVLSQVLRDPNVYGAIFNNKTYGYGHGLTPQDYGSTGNATDRHEDHVHAWYKPGGAGNIVPGAQPAAPVGIPGPETIPGGGGAPMHTGIGPANAVPGVTPLGPVTPAVGPGTSYPTPGGNSGNIVGGLPMDGIMAAAGAADLMMPGAGAAAKIGIQVANRTIGYMAQNAGILANGVGEFFSVGDNPKGSLGAGWLGKLAGGIAGAAPALPNLAGGKKPPGPMEQPGGGQQQGGDTNVNNQINVQAREGASGQEHGEQVAAETSRMWAPPGRQ